MQARASKLLQQGLPRVLARQFHHGATHGITPLAGAITPAVGQPSSPSLFSIIFGKKSVQGPSMLVPLAGVPVIPPLDPGVKPAETLVTTLPNGVRIASQDRPGPTAAVGVYVDSGSVWETPYETGISHLLERMAFKSTTNRTHFRLIREIEAIGAMCQASATREQMAYTADVVKLYVPEAVELLADTIRNSLYNDWEVQEQIKKLQVDISDLLARNPQALLLESLHSAGFVGGLSHSLLGSASALGRISGQQLFDFVQHNYTAPRIVVAAAGVPHDEFKDIVEPLFCDIPDAEMPQYPQSQYIGGDVRMAADSPLTHMAFAFEFPGGWRNEKDSYTALVFQALMGGGLSFSSGGPGKGMHSRLYSRVLQKYGEAHACSLFSSLYNDTGLIGIQASCGSEFIPNMVDLVVDEFAAVASTGGVTEEELQRAKATTTAQLYFNLESRAVVAEDIGRQILTYGHRKSAESFVESINAVSAKDIASFAKKLTKSPLAFAAYGDVVHVPRYDQIASRFGK